MYSNALVLADKARDRGLKHGTFMFWNHFRFGAYTSTIVVYRRYYLADGIVVELSHKFETFSKSEHDRYFKLPQPFQAWANTNTTQQFGVACNVLGVSRWSRLVAVGSPNHVSEEVEATSKQHEGVAQNILTHSSKNGGLLARYVLVTYQTGQIRYDMGETGARKLRACAP